MVPACNCIATSNFGLIHANCSDACSASSGFQVTVQLSNASGVQKLYSNQSMDPHTPVTGLYQVTILFVIREGIGILDSDRVPPTSLSSEASTTGAPIKSPPAAVVTHHPYKDVEAS